MSDVPYHTSIKEMPENDRPRERLAFYGVTHLREEELLAIILRTGSRTENAVHLSRRLLGEFQGLAGVAGASVAELCRVPGIGPAKAAQVQAALELGKRLAAVGAVDRYQVTSPRDAAVRFMAEMQGLAQEELRVMLLDTRHRLLRIVRVYTGNVNTSLIRISEVFREAIRDNAPAIIVAHNHPTGDVTPSADDILVTKELVKAGELMDIKLLDHLIIGQQSFLSMKERGLGF
jgi:DNA repair protein RadC